jgi:hypothetical protein
VASDPSIMGRSSFKVTGAGQKGGWITTGLRIWYFMLFSCKL